MMLSFEVVGVSVATVFKLGFAVFVGIGLSRFLSDPKRSLTGFSYMSVRLPLPCMMFGNMCLDFSVELFSQYYWAVIMSLIPMLLGAIASFLTFKLVSSEYRVLIMLGSTFQNGLVFPLSVVTNIKGIAWLDEKAVKECQQYIFLYNLSCALFLWSLGGPMIKHFKDKAVRATQDALDEAYYEQRKQRSKRMFMKELQDRVSVRGSDNTSYNNSATKNVYVEADVAIPLALPPAQEAGQQQQQQQNKQTLQQKLQDENRIAALPRVATAMYDGGDGGAPHGRDGDDDPSATRHPLSPELSYTAHPGHARFDGSDQHRSDDKGAVDGEEGEGEGQHHHSETVSVATTMTPVHRHADLHHWGDGTASETGTSMVTTPAEMSMNASASNWHRYRRGSLVSAEGDAAVDNAVGPAPEEVELMTMLSASPDAILAQYQRFFAPQEEGGLVFPQLLDTTAGQADSATGDITSPTIAPSISIFSASVASPTIVGDAATAAERAARRLERHRRRAEQKRLLDEKASPTTRGQLVWYRPARRKARPIDMAKYDRWRHLADAKEGQGADGVSPTAMDDLPVLDPVLGGGPVAYPPALGGGGIYSDVVHGADSGGAAATTDAAAAAEESAKPQDPQDQHERAVAEIISNTRDLHTLAIFAPGTAASPAGGAGGGDGDGDADGNGDLFKRNRDHVWSYRWKKTKEFFLFAVQTPPVTITILAILVSILPPLRWCAETYLGLSIIKGIALVGEACVPFQLVVLGCVLAAKKTEAAPLILQDPLESETEDSSSSSGEDNDDADGRRSGQEAALQQQPSPAPGGADPSHARVGSNNETTEAGTAEAIVASQPLPAVIDALAPGVDEPLSPDVRAHAGEVTTTTRRRKSTAGNPSRRKMQRQLRNIAIRQKREMIAAMGVVRRVWHRIPDATRFTVIVLMFRLVVLPAISFLIVHWLIQLGTMPLDRPFIVSILIGISSPAAVNASLICTFNDYHSAEFARMMFVMYCMAMVTSTIWLALSISYTSAYVTEVPPPEIPEDW